MQQTASVFSNPAYCNKTDVVPEKAQLAVKLHFQKEVFRTRMEATKEKSRVDDIRRLARTAWPELVHRDFNVFYVDDDGDNCPLIEESWADLVSLVSERPTTEIVKRGDYRMDLYLKFCREAPPKGVDAVPVVTIDAPDYNGASPPVLPMNERVITIRNESGSQTPVTVMLCPCALMKSCVKEGFCCGAEGNSGKTQKCPTGSNSRTETDWVVPENPEEESKDDAEEAEEAAASEDGDD
ncbi:hypothetical protein Pmar_PMAR012011 [Perkinsus marinus ATCC 50983]|uniref:PB1 domain-containing protein n=1 Tax=Perkinsus marinus (strain ATCC 50983 / TXsc) TaxID=423536 RepID=C5LW66_PERM5|nr:hypothetical protein Pmar_PMAR012011 [Perkinsus marinus ATCC 50983]EEQ99003.1 hypothetical protein Pmar_PMAR012011 [Perkinsus marinus ATCC 50983]|eukprot:XP_002766286.1 hypothetical protein Pmar_PMAR012011 [Perkinsus marinus ATCC 50983]